MKQEVIEILQKYHQEHILNYLNLLTEKEVHKLETQILAIDFEQLNKLYQESQKPKEIKENRIEHIEYTDKAKLDVERKEKLEEIGKEIIKQGKYVVITMAGGQGTRLGHTGPKGTYRLETCNRTKIYI